MTTAIALPFPNPTDTGQWAKDLLTGAGDPLTPTDVGYMEAWEARESPSGYGYNPLGTEETAPGSIIAPGNTATVQAFTSWRQGIAATLDTFSANPKNGQLLADLHTGNASLAQLSADQAIPGASWATGGESSISTLGTPTAFKYGGKFGLVPNAPGVPGDQTTSLKLIGPYSPGGPFPLGGGAGGVVGGIVKSTKSSIEKLVLQGVLTLTGAAMVVYGITLLSDSKGPSFSMPDVEDLAAT